MAPLRVAVIGGGPGGMFFAHAIDHHRRELIEKNNSSISRALADFPIVSVFERDVAPGGVWRAKKKQQQSAADEGTKTQMYADLWTNGPAHAIEFFDLTFAEHFGGSVPVYLPRYAVLEYIQARVTQHCPNFFERYMQFEHEVVHTAFNEQEQEFEVTVKDLKTGQDSVQRFDKVVWAGGENGKPSIPPDQLRALREGGFTGRIYHASDADNLEEVVRDKRVLLIGGESSAEDLALQSIKLGADKVYIATRKLETNVHDTCHWPDNKVEILSGKQLVAVTDQGCVIQFRSLRFHWPKRYEPSGEATTELRDIDSIIFCTGYKPNLDMLEVNLSKAGVPTRSGFGNVRLETPQDWEMSPNVLTNRTGSIPANNPMYHGGVTHPGLYRGVLISNPSMMFVSEYDSEFPLLSLDASVWLLAGYVSGRIQLPSQLEMNERNRKQAFAELNLPYYRYIMDEAYFNAVVSLYGTHSLEQDTIIDELWGSLSHDAYRYDLKILAQTMREGGYPLDIGALEELNDKGNTLFEFEEKSAKHRCWNEEDHDDEATWRTFRDYTNPEDFWSIYTGTKAMKLPHPWIFIKPQDDEASRIEFGRRHIDVLSENGNIWKGMSQQILVAVVAVVLTGISSRWLSRRLQATKSSSSFSTSLGKL